MLTSDCAVQELGQYQQQRQPARAWRAGGGWSATAAELPVTPAAMAYQDMDRFSSFAQRDYPRKAAEHDLDKSLAPMKGSGSQEELVRLPGSEG